jgi:hypothetical protein
MILVLESDESTKESVESFASLVQMAIYTVPFNELNTLLTVSDFIFKTERILHR